MIGSANCIYETPCGWCSKWDKKCDRKIGKDSPTPSDIYTPEKSREKYIPTLIETQETEVFIRLLSILKKMSLEEIDTYIRLSVEKNAVEITSRLMEHKQKHYSPEKIEKYTFEFIWLPLSLAM